LVPKQEDCLGRNKQQRNTESDILQIADIHIEVYSSNSNYTHFHQRIGFLEIVGDAEFI
jgi:hypothetical protein